VKWFWMSIGIYIDNSVDMKTNLNIKYKTDEIERFFSKNRIAWDQFYESEKVIISALKLSKKDQVLDIGCGCGGLGLALKNKFNIQHYTGIEINTQAAETAKIFNPSSTILNDDFLEVSNTSLKNKHFDVVFSLACFDWNIQFDLMLKAAWEKVADGGKLVATFRLVNDKSVYDINESFQFINYDGKLQGEKAAYVVINAKELIEKLLTLLPSEIKAFGYFGSPSTTAVTPYKEICFAAFSISRQNSNESKETHFNLELPPSINI
jgi:precorrin-6B methylase 2